MLILNMCHQKLSYSTCCHMFDTWKDSERVHNRKPQACVYTIT